MENSKELKPCPCCGGKAEQGTTSLADTYSDYEQIECTVCGLAIPLVIDGDMKGGIKRWNTRHDDAAIRKECADRAVAWAIENVNDSNDITNPPRFDKYDAASLRAAIETNLQEGGGRKDEVEKEEKP